MNLRLHVRKVGRSSRPWQYRVIQDGQIIRAVGHTTSWEGAIKVGSASLDIQRIIGRVSEMSPAFQASGTGVRNA